MALISLEEATDGMLRAGGRQSLAMAVRGLLNTGAVAAIINQSRGFLANIGSTGRRMMPRRRGNC